MRIHPLHHHFGEDVADIGARHHPLAGLGIDSAGGQCGAHGRQVGGVQHRRALLGVHRAGFHGIAVERSRAVHQPGDGLVVRVGGLLGSVDLLAEGQRAPGERTLDIQDLAPSVGRIIGVDEAGRRDRARVDQR